MDYSAFISVLIRAQSELVRFLRWLKGDMRLPSVYRNKVWGRQVCEIVTQSAEVYLG
jgi:hypothetical protein